MSDRERWEQHATLILGLEAMNSGFEDVQFFRMGENHHRLAIHHGPSDDLAYVGWETTDETMMWAIARQLESMGVTVTPGTTSEAADRKVDGLIKVSDPNGVATEIYHGPTRWSDAPFRAPRGIAGFNADDLGMGHVALNVDSYEDSMTFYRGGLGLQTSDYIDLDFGNKGSMLVGFLSSGPAITRSALVEFETERRLHHIMLKLLKFDDVGATFDLCQDEGIPIVTSLGTHTNDRMTAFYIETPSGFQIEYGTGGRLVGNDWEVITHTSASTWGHRARTGTPLLRSSVAI